MYKITIIFNLNKKYLFVYQNKILVISGQQNLKKKKKKITGDSYIYTF